MITQSPIIRVKTNSPIGNDLFFALPDLSGNNNSFLDADVASGVSALVANGTFLSADDYIIIGQPGQAKSEIVKVSSATATAINLSSALIFSHNRGDVVTVIEYNQIVPELSTDGGATFTPQSAIDINPQALETYLARTSDAVTDVYNFRFYNEQTTLYSGYSDSSIATGYADNTVYAIKKHALSQMGEKKSELITDDFLNDALNEARRIVDMGTATVEGVQQRVLRWSFRTKFNTDIGSIIPGTYSIAVPTDLRDRNTYKNILGLRIGRQNWPLSYQDRPRFNQNYLNVGHTTLASSVTIGDPTITLTSSGDFDDSGNIYIAGTTVAEVNDIVAYTSNDEATNVISGVIGIGTNKASGTDVWQNVTFGLPTNYTIDNGVIYFDVPFADEYKGQNIYLDYYQALQPVNSDSDVLDEPTYDGYVNYLKFKIKSLKSNGSLNPKEDGDFLLFQQWFSNLVSQEVSGQVVNFVPGDNYNYYHWY